MDSGFWDDVGVETVAEIDGINVIAVKHHKSAQILLFACVLHSK